MPLGVQEEDYSTIKKEVDKLRSQGVVNLKEYLLENHEYLHDLVKSIRCTNVNQALLGLHGASTREEFSEEEEDTDKWWDQGWVEFFADEINTLDSDTAGYHEAERVDSRLDGSFVETRSIASVVQGYEESLGKNPNHSRGYNRS